jgi:hypothetical protein
MWRRIKHSINKNWVSSLRAGIKLRKDAQGVARNGHLPQSRDLNKNMQPADWLVPLQATTVRHMPPRVRQPIHLVWAAPTCCQQTTTGSGASRPPYVITGMCGFIAPVHCTGEPAFAILKERMFSARPKAMPIACPSQSAACKRARTFAAVRGQYAPRVLLVFSAC